MEQLFYLPQSMIWPLVACLVLTGIHVYLGVHVIARKVIFVDLALAQIAALGTVIGVLLGYEVGKDAMQLYLYSLAFTIFGAFIFSVTKMKGEKVPHEAIIGIVYAVTFAGTILVLSKSALGPQELDHIIKGELLWVQGPTVIKTAIIYACVGLFHYVFRRQFMAISFDSTKAEADGINVRLWDFLFYMSFGFVITSSVSIAGVFLVFSYLVIPSVGAMLISDKLSTRLAIGWVAGSIISFIGVKLSYTTGYPTSPLVVVVLASALILSGIVRYVRTAARPFIAVRNMFAYIVIAALFGFGVYSFRKADEDPLEHTLHMLDSKLSTDRSAALLNLAGFTDRKERWLPAVVERLRDEDAEVRKGSVELLKTLKDHDALGQIVALLHDKSDEVRRSAAGAVAQLGDSADGNKLAAIAVSEDDPEMKVAMLKAAIELGAKDAIPPLCGVLRDGTIFADDAYDILRGHINHDFKKNDGTGLLRWWNENASHLRWDGASKLFVPAK